MSISIFKLTTMRLSDEIKGWNKTLKTLKFLRFKVHKLKVYKVQILFVTLLILRITSFKCHFFFQQALHQEILVKASDTFLHLFASVADRFVLCLSLDKFWRSSQDIIAGTVYTRITSQLVNKLITSPDLKC